MTGPVQVEHRGDVRTVTLASEGGNLVSEEMSVAIVDALTTIPPEIKLVRFATAGADFCLGRRSPSLGGSVDAAQARAIVADGPLRLYRSFKTCPVPILGLVQGRAFGVGCAIAGLCDLTIADPDASFCIPELDRDIAPTLVMTALADRISYKHLTHLVFSRERIGAANAAAIGLVSQVAEAASLSVAADELTQRLTACSALALRGVKEFMLSAPRLDLIARDSLAGTINAAVSSSARRI